jgi:predicted nucleotidyltransferase
MKITSANLEEEKSWMPGGMWLLIRRACLPIRGGLLRLALTVGFTISAGSRHFNRLGVDNRNWNGRGTVLKLYTSQSRQETLEKLHKALKSNERIGGVLLVASGAYRFFDEFSDLDLAVVVNEGQDALAVFRDWDSVIQNLLPVPWRFADVRTPEVRLYALILTDFLEVDISFQSLSALEQEVLNVSILYHFTSVSCGYNNGLQVGKHERIAQNRH